MTEIYLNLNSITMIKRRKSGGLENITFDVKYKTTVFSCVFRDMKRIHCNFLKTVTFISV